MLVLADAYLPLVPGLRSPVECTVPLRAVAKTGCGWGQDGEPPLAEALLQRLEHNGCELMRQADSKNHSQLWLSLSEGPREVAVRHAQLLDVSASQLVQMGAQGIGEQACGNVLLACARLLPRMSLGDPATLLHHLTERMVQLRGEAAEQALANTVYALARLHEQCGYTPLPEHLQALAAEVWERLSAKPGAHQERFAPQSLSNMLWAFAKFCYGHPDLLTRLAGAAAEAARRMDEQELSNSVWALGRLVEAGCLDGTKSVTGVERLSAEALWRVRHQRGAFPSQALANLLLGLAHLSSAAPPGTYKLGATVHALAAECRFGLKYQGFTSQGLTNAAWALAKLEYGDQAWYAGCAAAALQPSFYKVAVRQCWAHLWWALAAARHRPADAQLLLARTTDAMTAMRHQANGQDCNNIVWALATLGLYDSQLVRCLLGRLAELQPHGDASAQHFSNALWAVAVMGPVALSAHLQEVGALLREVARRWQGFPGRAAFQEEHLRQLWHVQVELEAHPSTDVRALAGVLPGAVSSGLSLGSAMSLAKKRKLALDSASRRVCNEVALLLQNLQQQQQQQREQPNHGSRIQSSCGLRLGPTITSLDVGGWVEQVARWVSVEVRLEGGRAVAVLVDGPDIVMANQPQERVGGALLHRRQLQRVYGEGNVVGVSVAEWEALGGDVGRQEGLLRTLLLQGAGGQQGSGSGYAQRDASAVQPLSAFQAPSSSGPSRSAPASPPVAKPPSVQELVRQRLQQMAPQAKGRSRRRPV